MEDQNDSAPNTKIRYLYRDAANYKSWGTIVVAGRVRFRDIEPYLFDGILFLPEYVRFPRLPVPGKEWDDELDHVYHELSPDFFTPTSDPPTISIDSTKLIECFRLGASRGWQYE